MATKQELEHDNHILQQRLDNLLLEKERLEVKLAEPLEDRLLKVELLLEDLVSGIEKEYKKFRDKVKDILK